MHNDMFCVADVIVVLAERKLTSYVYAVGLMMMKELESATFVVKIDAINVVSAVSDNTEFSLESAILGDVKQLLGQL
ncbi:hypothetical protein TIFTF001_034439 [Ficus carica]|uniref:Uncharacterized protein n=1 Tax=Ficus carica TaxID=3494 RepID=A0AA88E199_FICCA|nr:hypothetical protein TIFTF001_034439 [Ficus carica]